MEANKRAIFALVAATLVNQRQYNSVYAYDLSKHIAVSSSNVTSNSPHFYDHNRGAAISGDKQSLYDYATGSHVSTNINGSSVECYDYESGRHITFIVNGSNVSAYDYETSTHYNFNVN